jgi:hypothetical protein
MVIGILRMGVGRYGLDLRRSMLEILSDIYYRMNFCETIVSGSAAIVGQIIVQVDARRRAIIFVGVVGGRFCWA